MRDYSQNEKHKQSHDGFFKRERPLILSLNVVYELARASEFLNQGWEDTGLGVSYKMPYKYTFLMVIFHLNFIISGAKLTTFSKSTNSSLAAV